MENLDLPYPRKIDFAVPGNTAYGEYPDNVPEEYRGPCDITEAAASDTPVSKQGDHSHQKYI